MSTLRQQAPLQIYVLSLLSEEWKLEVGNGVPTQEPHTPLARFVQKLLLKNILQGCHRSAS